MSPPTASTAEAPAPARDGTPAPDAPPVRRRTAPARTRIRAWHRWVSPLALLALWQLGSLAGIIPDRLLPAPTTVADTGADLLLDGTLLPAVGTSLQRALIGFAAGATAALLLAVAAGRRRRGQDLVYRRPTNR